MQLLCEAIGKPTPIINWTRVLEDGSNGEVLHRGPTWDFPNINRTDAGTYRCTAYNGFGNEVNQVVKVNVICKYFTVCETLFINNKRALWSDSQPITTHIFDVTDLSASCIYGMEARTRPIRLLYNFG